MVKKVGIIGAGLGGLSAGLFLLKKGYDVTVFEKEGLVGGRALSINGSNLTIDNYKKILSKYSMRIAFSNPSLEEIFRKKMLEDYKLDLGFHSVGGGETSPLGLAVSDTGYKVGFLGTRLGFIKEKGYKYPLLNFTDKLSMLPNIVRLYSYKEKKMEELDTVSIDETLKKFGKGKTKFVLELLPRVITTVNDLTKISTGEAFRANQLNIKKGSSPVGYPVGGFESVNNALVKAIETNKGKILLNNEILEIIIKDNIVQGVRTKDKKYDFDIIVYNGFVQDLFKISDEKCFPKEYVNHLQSLKGTGSLCAYYSLKQIPKELIGKSFLFIERNIGLQGCDAVGMIEFVTSSPCANISPKSDYVVQSYIICTPEEARSKENLEKLKHLLDKNLKSLIPDLNEQLNWSIYPTVWHLDGVAKTIDNDKPDIKTPIKNLYLVGDCVKAPGIGVNCAVNSARILCETL